MFSDLLEMAFSLVALQGGRSGDKLTARDIALVYGLFRVAEDVLVFRQ